MKSSNAICKGELKQERMGKLCKLSGEMNVQILTRLPPKALIRFKCVCRSLCSLINSPSFVAKNLSNAMDNKFASPTSILFKRTVLKDNSITDKREILNIMSDGNTDKKEVLLSLLNLSNNIDSEHQNPCSIPEDLVLPFPMNIDPWSLKIVGHCDGIVCLTSKDHVVLCNPAIKEFKFLPKSYLLLPPKHRDDYDNEDDYYDALASNPIGVGFGYDSRGEVYKVVRVVAFSSGYVFTSHPSRAEVYTLSAHSWKEINIDPDTCIMWTPSSEIYCKGFFYWSGLTYPTPGNAKDVIISFEMSGETFHEISLPESIVFGSGVCTSLAVWKGSIALLSYEYEERTSKLLHIWVMDDCDGLKNVWRNLLSIGPVEGDIPLIFWRSDEVLVVTTDGRVVSYNLSTQVHKYFPIYGIEDHQYIQAVVYVNSIISFGGENQLKDIQ
ncbi:F-box/kelch-repeat protein At3g06240-like [Argentina anserina]|uniref:F-box/kelch-repeat protein At3g06240-like n=1 Tax=Argentina anserina TaxID=57926 RepID=UPI0021762869|nr:F-box/kelch-repeat protein At3g06240-like [Potentilla anserina]